MSELLVQSLAKQFGVEFSLSQQHIVNGRSVTITATQQNLPGGILQSIAEVKTFYRLGKNGIDIFAYVFSYLGGIRVHRTTDRVPHYFVLFGTANDDGGISWRDGGWQADEYGEWDYITDPQYQFGSATLMTEE